MHPHQMNHPLPAPSPPPSPFAGQVRHYNARQPKSPDAGAVPRNLSFTLPEANPDYNLPPDANHAANNIAQPPAPLPVLAAPPPAPSPEPPILPEAPLPSPHPAAMPVDIQNQPVLPAAYLLDVDAPQLPLPPAPQPPTMPVVDEQAIRNVNPLNQPLARSNTLKKLLSRCKERIQKIKDNITEIIEKRLIAAQTFNNQKYTIGGSLEKLPFKEICQELTKKVDGFLKSINNADTAKSGAFYKQKAGTVICGFAAALNAAERCLRNKTIELDIGFEGIKEKINEAKHNPEIWQVIHQDFKFLFAKYHNEGLLPDKIKAKMLLLDAFFSTFAGDADGSFNHALFENQAKVIQVIDCILKDIKAVPHNPKPNITAEMLINSAGEAISKMQKRQLGDAIEKMRIILDNIKTNQLSEIIIQPIQNAASPENTLFTHIHFGKQSPEKAHTLQLKQRLFLEMMQAYKADFFDGANDLYDAEHPCFQAAMAILNDPNKISPSLLKSYYGNVSSEYLEQSKEEMAQEFFHFFKNFIEGGITLNSNSVHYTTIVFNRQSHQFELLDSLGDDRLTTEEVVDYLKKANKADGRHTLTANYRVDKPQDRFIQNISENHTQIYETIRKGLRQMYQSLAPLKELV